jgi:hypothetical protein
MLASGESLLHWFLWERVRTAPACAMEDDAAIPSARHPKERRK